MSTLSKLVHPESSSQNDSPTPRLETGSNGVATPSAPRSAIFANMAEHETESIHFKHDPASGLNAIIAIHSTRLGPALGGCRFVEYSSESNALEDVMRLAQGMSYKAALAGVPHGGGKAVILKPKHITNRNAIYTAFGKFVDELGGRYITAIDSGTTLDDMDIVEQVTPYVSGSHVDGLDPSPLTALGVFTGIRAALSFRLNKEELKGVRVAIQGLGNVGYALAGLLYEAGAKLIVSDIDDLKAERCANEFRAKVVGIDDIYSVDCEVFAPCGLGAIVNDYTYEQFKCSVIAGSANNQLAEPYHGRLLEERNILYAPDYVINSGGLIKVALGRQGASENEITSKVIGIAKTLRTIFERADEFQQPTFEVADSLAKEKLSIKD